MAPPALQLRPVERAQRCYRAVGSEAWTLDDPGWTRFLADVDPAASGCLMMRLTRPA
jgi:hypothetical protein